MEIIRQYAFSDIATFFCGSETLAVRDVLFDVQLQDHDGMVILTPRFQMSFRMEIVPLIAIESNKDTVRLSTRLPKLYSVFLWMYCSRSLSALKRRPLYSFLCSWRLCLSFCRCCRKSSCRMYSVTDSFCFLILRTDRFFLRCCLRAASVLSRRYRSCNSHRLSNRKANSIDPENDNRQSMLHSPELLPVNLLSWLN